MYLPQTLQFFPPVKLRSIFLLLFTEIRKNQSKNHKRFSETHHVRFQDIGFPCAVQVIGIVLREDEVSGHLAGVLGSVEGFVPPVDSREAETPA